MIKGVNHIGVVVEDIDKAVALWEKAFGAKLISKEENKEMGQVLALIAVGDAYFEFMQPVGEDGILAGYFKECGEGIHHISICTDNILEDLKQVEEAGLKVRWHDDVKGFLYKEGNFDIFVEMSPDHR